MSTSSPKKTRSGPKPNRGSKKGGAFERTICKQLSLWWSKGASDNVFYRTPNSGGRATTRLKSGKLSHGAGDIQTTDIDGRDLIEKFYLELKNGYNHSLSDAVFDNDKADVWGWIDKAIQGSEVHGQRSWWLIWKQDFKSTTIMLPYGCLRRLGRKPSHFGPSLLINTVHCAYFVCTLDDFLKNVKPMDVIRYPLAV